MYISNSLTVKSAKNELVLSASATRMELAESIGGGSSTFPLYENVESFEDGSMASFSGSGVMEILFINGVQIGNEMLKF
jgi:hypothetical protein